jgi:uncharacterized protein
MSTHEKPRKNEDEYFVRQEAELLKQLRAKQDAERAKAERSAHYMKCPKCGADLHEKKLGHALVDVCPECQGMWLDAGELEILRRGGAEEPGGRGFFQDLRDLFSTGGEQK